MNKNHKLFDQDYQTIETEDGSKTLYSELYHEACHSRSGARNETIFQYINGCQISREYNPFGILEIGFGVGLGPDLSFEAMGPKRVNFISFEIDERLVQRYLQEKNIPFSRDADAYIFELSKDFKVKVYVGNARNMLSKIPPMTFHAIYQDAFSPKKNPELWTLEWFKDLYEKSTNETILSTYCSSQSVRKTMIKAGWKIYEGGSFGRKRSSTRAKVHGELDAKLEFLLQSEKIPLLTDVGLNT